MTYPTITALGVALVDTTSAATGLVDAGVHSEGLRGFRGEDEDQRTIGLMLVGDQVEDCDDHGNSVDKFSKRVQADGEMVFESCQIFGRKMTFLKGVDTRALKARGLEVDLMTSEVLRRTREFLGERRERNGGKGGFISSSDSQDIPPRKRRTRILGFHCYG